MLSTLIGNLPGMAYRCLNDQNWTMEFISEGSHALTGYVPSDLIGNRTLSYNELIHPDDRQSAWEQVQKGLAKHQPFRLVYRIQTAGGQEKWVWEQGQGVFVENGDLLAIEGFITDITERTLAEEALRESGKRFRALLDVVPSPIVVFSLDGLVSFLNPAFTKLFGWTIAELRGKQLPYGSPEIEIEAGESLRRILEEGGLVPYETKRMTKDGRVLDVVTRGVVYTESKGEPSGALIILRDITLEKNVLTINGFVETQQPDNYSLAYAEYDTGQYERSFTLTNEIDRDRIEATVKDGVLRLHLPKIGDAKTKKIAVKAI